MGQITVDSFKIRIPLSRVTIKDKNIEGDWILVNTETGEVSEEEYKRKAVQHKQKGISTRFAIEVQVTQEQTKQTFFTALVNAKKLQGKYLEGMTPKNIHLVYEYLMNLNVFWVSLEDFLSGEVTDVDVKTDYVLPNLKEVVKDLGQNTIPRAAKDGGHTIFNARNNVGIQWGHRKTQKTKTFPYVKIYSKMGDLYSKSNEFYREFLEPLDIDVKDLVRCEVTIKNKKHFRAYGIEGTKLKDVLCIPQGKLKEIMGGSIKAHLEPKVKVLSKEDTMLSDRDTFTLNLIKLLIDNGVSYAQTKYALMQGVSRSFKSRELAKMDTIYQDKIKGSKKDIQTENVWRFYQAIGYAPGED